MKTFTKSAVVAAGAVWTLAGCVAGPRPDPIIIHETPREIVALRYDARGGSGHSHPVPLAPARLAEVLSRVRVTPRDTLGLGGLFSKDETFPAFTASEIAALAPPLAEALRKASPRDIVTFYLLSSDPRLGRLITSGGLFVREDNHLYLILANVRTSPSAGKNEGIAYEMDNRNDPLTPIARYRFTVSFDPEEARIANAIVKQSGEYNGYLDESKQLVVDLNRIPQGTGTR